MKLWMTGTLLATMVLGLMGCVSQAEADRWQDLYKQSESQRVELEQRLEQLQTRINALQTAQRRTPEMQRELDALTAERNRLRDALNEAQQQLSQLAAGPGDIPEELHAALVDLAERNPGLMTYDPDRGMVKFQSDLTFALGSAEVQEQAGGTLRRLADVLRTEAAQPYEIRIVGHTDNVPIGNPETRANHPTNWHLSAHRAIAVKDALEEADLAPARMSVAGYGPYRPVVPNGPNGAKANRRVELFLVPMPESANAGQGAAQGQRSQQGRSAAQQRNAGGQQPIKGVTPGQQGAGEQPIKGQGEEGDQAPVFFK